MEKSCFECGENADVNHHVIPQSLGGTKTVPLCNKCHSLVHDSNFVTCSKLSVIGKRITNNLKTINSVLKMHENKVNKTAIAKKLGIGRKCVYSILTKNNLHFNVGKGCKKVVTSNTIDEIQKMRMKKMSWSKIEKKLGISHTHLFRIINKLNLKGTYNSKIKNRAKYKTCTPELLEKAKELRSKRLTWQQIADILGIERATLYRNDFPKQFASLRGSLTPKKKITAIKLLESGWKMKDIAKTLKVSVGTLYFNKISKRKIKS